MAFRERLSDDLEDPIATVNHLFELIAQWMKVFEEPTKGFAKVPR